VKLIPVDLKDLEITREGRRGRVSYPLIKQFLESGHLAALVDRTGVQQTSLGLMSALRSYAKNHNIPVSIFMRRGEIYLVRLDLNEDGTENPNWREDARAAEEAVATPLTPAVVVQQVQGRDVLKKPKRRLAEA